MRLEQLVNAKGFNAADFVGVIANSPTSFALRENLIERLPLVQGGVVDIYDVGIDAADHKGYRLVLRLSKLRKTFYIVNKQRSFTKKIGTWISKPENRIYPDGSVGLSQVRELFKELVAENEATKDDKERVSEMTIRGYLNNRYQRDRDITPIKSGVIKPVRKETISSLICAIEPWVDLKLSDAKETWPQDFKDFWKSTPRYNPGNHKEIKQLKEDTMRQYYASLNAMYGICVKRGYISKNVIDGHTHLFKRTKAEKVVVYDYDYHDVLSFIFSIDVNEKLSHKLIVASMIVTGARNSEIFKNYRENFRTDKREIFIPGKISKNKNVSRTVPVESDLYWEKVNEYLEDFENNEHGHMFPSKKAKDGHVTDNVYRDVWEAVKKKYNLKAHARLYNNRSTYGTRLAKEHSIEVAAKMIGDTLETTAKYYLHHDADAARGTLQKLFNQTSPESSAPAPPSHKEQPTNLIRIGKMPHCVDELFQQFLGGKDTSVVEGKIDSTLWLKFVSKIKSRSEKGKSSEEETDWLDMISE